MRETLDGDAVPISPFVEVGDRVVVRLAWRAAGHGPEIDMEGTTINTVRNRRLCGIEFFWNHAEALEAAGRAE